MKHKPLPPIIEAFLRHEKAAGGIAKADSKSCLRAAADECGMAYGEARTVYLDWFAGNIGVG